MERLELEALLWVTKNRVTKLWVVPPSLLALFNFCRSSWIFLPFSCAPLWLMRVMSGGCGRSCSLRRGSKLIKEGKKLLFSTYTWEPLITDVWVLHQSDDDHLEKMLSIAFEQTLVEPNMLVVDVEKFLSPQQETSCSGSLQSNFTV